jgi:Fe-S cluster biosynthesis and repair protein YggX
MSVKKIYCKKLKEELPALENPPFSGNLGSLIHLNISERAWRLWSEDMMIKVINEYRLNLADAGDYERLLDQMKIFLCLDDQQEGQLLEVGNPERGK